MQRATNQAGFSLYCSESNKPSSLSAQKLDGLHFCHKFKQALHLSGLRSNFFKISIFISEHL